MVLGLKRELVPWPNACHWHRWRFRRKPLESTGREHDRLPGAGCPTHGGRDNEDAAAHSPVSQQTKPGAPEQASSFLDKQGSRDGSAADEAASVCPFRDIDCAPTLSQTLFYEHCCAQDRQNSCPWGTYILEGEMVNVCNR